MERKGLASFLIGNILGVLALAGFAATLLLVLPGYFLVFTLLPPSRAPHVAHRLISRNWARLLFPLFFIRFKVNGKESIDPDKTYVFIANHRSQLDIPAYALACSNTFRFLAKKELTKIPGLGWIIRKLYLTVDRKDHSERVKSMDAMRKSLEEGISVFVCPEGTRNTSERPLLPFKDGAFRLAIETQTPLAILTVKGSADRLSPKHPLTLLPGPLVCEWSIPIETKGMTLSDLEILKETARKTITENLTDFS
ncbi:MAG: lysophospholipid acyltransferase family protein [Bacteroidota bacterium]